MGRFVFRDARRGNEKRSSPRSEARIELKKYASCTKVVFSFKGKAAALLSAKDRIALGFSDNENEVAFVASDTEGFKYSKRKDDTVYFETSSPENLELFGKHEGEHIPRYEDGGIVYFDFELDSQINSRSEAEKVKAETKARASQEIETGPSEDILSDGSKVYVATFDCICRQCGKPIKVIVRSGEKGKPVEPSMEYYMKTDLGTRTYVLPNGHVEKGIPYSRKAKGIKEGYHAHWETCAANNQGRK